MSEAENQSDEQAFVSPLRRFLAKQYPYTLTRFLLLRLLALVYLVAFLIAFFQIVPLVGEHGLLPANAFLNHWIHQTGGKLEAFRRLPTLFVFLGASDTTLRAFAGTGALLSLAVLLGATNAFLQLALFLLYMSIVRVGQIFYGYGWEIQLLETGFLSIFLCPIRAIRPFASAPPVVTILLFRWLIVRIMLGAGLIKIRGDACWTDLSCLAYHYETQPNPSPTSVLFHHLPKALLSFGVFFNHVVELVAPFFAFWPRKARIAAGILFIGFQLTLIASGNLSFLNWLTIIPAIACFDDECLLWLVPKSLRARIPAPRESTKAQTIAASLYAAIVAILSIGPVSNLLSKKQVMNTSFEPLGLVNTYGAFGSVDRERYEIILSGTASESPDEEATWLEYEFPCKPGDIQRRPCLITPYHYRLDWQMWFAAKSRIERQPWLIHLVDKILRGDNSAKPLLAHDPFPDKPPRFLRAQLYRYRFAPIGDKAHWERELVGEYMRPVAEGDKGIEQLLRAYKLRE